MPPPPAETPTSPDPTPSGQTAGARRPEISIIVPAHDVETHIAAAISSLRGQSFADFEAIVVNDGSTDGTATAAEAAIDGDPRFRLVEQENRGLSGARNRGLDLARGRFVAFLDGDDRFAPTFLEEMHGALLADGGDWIACAIAFCTPDGTLHPHSAIHGRTVPADPPEPTRADFSDWTSVIPHFPSAWNKLYRRDFIGETRFDAGTWFEDHGFFHRLAARSGHMAHLPRPLYLYTLHRVGQITGTDSDRVFEQFAVLDRSAGILRGAGKPGAEVALARLATRLCIERLDTIRDPARAERFLTEAAAFFHRNGLAPDWQWDQYLPVLRSSALAGQAPILLRGGPASGADRPPILRRIGRDEAVSPALAVLDLPDGAEVEPELLIDATERLLRSEASAIALFPAPDGPAEAAAKAPAEAATTAPEPMTEDIALHLHETGAALLCRTDRVVAPGHDAPFGTLDAAMQILRDGGSLLHAPLSFKGGKAQVPATPEATLAALDNLGATFAGAVHRPGWDRRLYLRRLAVELARVEAGPKGFGPLRDKAVLLWRLRRDARLRGWIGTPGAVDPDTPKAVLLLLRLPSPAPE